jgi:hypothetical protein
METEGSLPCSQDPATGLILKYMVVRVWIGFIWLRIGTGGELL